MLFLASYSMKYLQKVKMLSPHIYHFSKMAVKCHDLKWPRKSQKFNLHHLWKISRGSKMAVLTPKSGIHVTGILRGGMPAL